MNIAPEVIGVLGVVLLIVMIGLRMWVGVAMGLVGFAGLWILKDMSYALNILGSAPFSNLNSYTLTVVPMFTLMGMVISVTSIGPGLFKSAESFIGHFRGGLASATVIACAFLGAITGGQYGATLIMSKIALPEMRKRNYDDELSGACIAAAAPLAIVIPPSVSMIFFGILTETSVGLLFMGGIIPGIICALSFCVVVWLICRIHPEKGPKGEYYPWKARFKTLGGMIPTIILILCVLGTIYMGVATTTEAGAIGALGSIVIALCMRELDWNRFRFCLVETAKTCGTIFFLLAGSYVFTSFISISKLPFLLVDVITSLNVPVFVLMLAVVFLYFILGMFLPEIPMMLLTVPILWPALSSVGVSAIWFGVIIVMVMALGSITPPIGIVTFILSTASSIPATKIFKGLVPFIICEAAIILIVCIFPILTLLIPNSM